MSTTPAPTGGGGVTFNAGFDPANGYPVSTIVGPVSLGGGAFSYTNTVAATGGNPFSISVTGSLNSNGSGQGIGFNANNQSNGPSTAGTPVPEPASLAVWTVLAGIGYYSSRRRRAGAAGGKQPVKPAPSAA